MRSRFEHTTWISLPHATFVLVARNGWVVDAPPIARWAVGKRMGRVMAYYNRRWGSQLLWCTL